MKIAINKCFGGFSLSNQAIKRYLELKEKECYFYKQTKYHYKDGYDKWTKVNNAMNESNFNTTTFIKDMGDSFTEWPKDNSYSFYERNVQRNDPALIQTIEELKDEANGQCANLKVIEIPDDINYKITEYDGMETVEEVHKSWC